MAPRRGGGGFHTGGGGSASCPNAFQMGDLSTPIPYFVAWCFFWVVYVLILVGMGKVRKRHPHSRKIMGGIYGISVLFFLVGYSLLIIATMLKECETTDIFSFYDWAIAYVIFFGIATYLLLVVIVWVINDELRGLLGSKPVFFKIVYGVVLGVMGCLMVAFVSIQAYNNWTATQDGFDATPVYAASKLGLAYYVLYLAAVLGAGALAMISILNARSRQVQTGDLIGWMIALIVSMVIWLVFTLVSYGADVADDYSITLQFWEAYEWIGDAFQAIAFIIIAFIAKSRAFLPSANPNAQPGLINGDKYPVTETSQQTSYTSVPHPQTYPQNQANGGQNYYYPQGPVYHNGQQPVYSNTTSSVSGQQPGPRTFDHL